MSRVFPALAAAFALAACDLTTTPPQQTIFEWYGVLQGEDEWAHIQGEAIVSWDAGTDEVLTGAGTQGDEPGSVRPWHLRAGTCADPGAIVGAAGAYPPLEVDGDGMAVVITTVTAGLDPDVALNAVVLAAPDDTDTTIACAEMNRIN